MTQGTHLAPSLDKFVNCTYYIISFISLEGNMFYPIYGSLNGSKFTVKMPPGQNTPQQAISVD